MKTSTPRVFSRPGRLAVRRNGHCVLGSAIGAVFSSKASSIHGGKHVSPLALAPWSRIQRKAVKFGKEEFRTIFEERLCGTWCVLACPKR